MKPPDGAAPVKFTVPTDALPPTTEVGFIDSDASAAVALGD